MSGGGIMLPGGQRLMQIPMQPIEVNYTAPDGSPGVVSVPVPAVTGKDEHEIGLMLQQDVIEKVLINLLAETTQIRQELALFRLERAKVAEEESKATESKSAARKPYYQKGRRGG